MKNITITIAIILLQVSLHGQTSTMRSAMKMMDAYWAEPTVEHYEEAEALISEIWESEGASTDAIALLLKSELLTAQLTNEAYDESDDFDVFLEDIVDTYNKALIYDNYNRNRYRILKNLYNVKNVLTIKGVAHYQDKNFEKAFSYYDAASRMNEVEIKFPRIAQPDTSTIYTTGVMASLAGKDALAIKYLERVVELKYYRKDAYDQLIALYKKNKFDVKAKKMEIKKNIAFPSEQND